jgi:hypothetical protein
VEVSDGGTTNSRYIKITFEVTEGNQGLDKIGCSIDGQAFTSCTSPVVYDKLKKGTHEVTVRAWDFIGRFGEDEFTWAIGKAPVPPPRRGWYTYRETSIQKERGDDHEICSA